MLRTTLCLKLLVFAATWSCPQPAVPTPAPPPVNRKDPEAVVRAYVKACETADVAAAAALLEDKPGIRKYVADTAKSMTPDFARRGLTFGDMITEFALMPLGTVVAPAAAKATTAGNVTTVTVTRTPTLVHTFAVVKAPDGTWSIDLEASVCLTTGKPKSLMAARTRTRSPWETRGQFRKLTDLLMEYARQHGDRLPPAATWMDEVEKYCFDRSVLHRKDLKPEEYGYAINANAAGKQLPQELDERRSTILLMESADPSRNAAADPNALAARKRDAPPIWVATADGNILVLPGGMAVRGVTEARAAREGCYESLGELGRAVLAYARDHDGLLPSAASWCDDISPYIQPKNVAGRDVFRCPGDPEAKCGYALNADLAGKNARAFTDHAQIVLLLHGKTGLKNEVLAVPAKVEGGRHAPDYAAEYDKCDLVAMLDGSTREVPEGEAYPAPTPVGR